MKKIVKITKTELINTHIVDCAKEYRYIQEAFIDEDVETLNKILDQYIAGSIKPNGNYKTIILKNCYNLGPETTKKLTPHYLAGSVIDINGTLFRKAYPKANYKYEWVPFDRTQIPRSLAEYTVNGKPFLEHIKEAPSYYLPNKLWQALDLYSRERIQRCTELNKQHLDYEDAEQWYKEIYKTHCTKFFNSPNAKTYPEAYAEEQFEKAVQDLQLKPGLRPLNEEEVRFLVEFAPAYGIDIRTFDWRYDYRKTDNGYTQEPVRVYTAVSESEFDRTIFDGRNSNKTGEKTPYKILKNYRVRSERNEKLLREAYFHLKFIMKLKDDSFLAPGYKRCPICHKIYKESQGCEGHVPAYEHIQTDNLFYGIMNEFSDFETPEEFF